MSKVFLTMDLKEINELKDQIESLKRKNKDLEKVLNDSRNEKYDVEKELRYAKAFLAKVIFLNKINWADKINFNFIDPELHRSIYKIANSIGFKNNGYGEVTLINKYFKDEVFEWMK